MGTIDNSTEFDFNVDENQTSSAQNSEHHNVAPSPSPVSSVAQPQIPGDSAPYVVLCGPPSSGKSMILKSLANYLYQAGLGYSIAANTTLLNSAAYQADCKNFNRCISNPATRFENTTNYLLADIFDDRGNVVAHFLEAPGEHYFDLNNVESEPNIPFQGYLTKIAQVTINKPRKVIYIILLDLDSTNSFRNNEGLRKTYEQKMLKLYNSFVLNHPSRVVLLYNKADVPMQGLWANTGGVLNVEAIRKDALLNYPMLFNQFKRPFLFWKFDNYSFLPYCTGSYPADGSYTASGPAYPAELWKEITKLW